MPKDLLHTPHIRGNDGNARSHRLNDGLRHRFIDAGNHQKICKRIKRKRIIHKTVESNFLVQTGFLDSLLTLVKIFRDKLGISNEVDDDVMSELLQLLCGLNDCKLIFSWLQCSRYKDTKRFAISPR